LRGEDASSRATGVIFCADHGRHKMTFCVD